MYDRVLDATRRELNYVYALDVALPRVARDLGVGNTLRTGTIHEVIQ